MEAPIKPTTCSRCGKAFNTSTQNPRQFCSISCEEGRGPLPDSDAESPNYWLHIQGNPEALVGCALLTEGLRLTDYSPDWHKNPEDYKGRAIVEHIEEDTTLILKDVGVFVGRVYDYEDGVYKVESEDMETGKISYREIDESVVLSQLRQDVWWSDGA